MERGKNKYNMVGDIIKGVGSAAKGVGSAAKGVGSAAKGVVQSVSSVVQKGSQILTEGKNNPERIARRHQDISIPIKDLVIDVENFNFLLPNKSSERITNESGEELLAPQSITYDIGVKSTKDTLIFTPDHRNVIYSGHNVLVKYENLESGKSVMVKLSPDNEEHDIILELLKTLCYPKSGQTSGSILRAKYIGYLEDASTGYQTYAIVMPEIDGTLREFRQSTRRDIPILSGQNMINMLFNVVIPIKCLLDENLFYTDIKGANIFLTCRRDKTCNKGYKSSKSEFDNYRLILGDLGSIAIGGVNPTYTYPPPENRYVTISGRRQQIQATEKSIVWGLGLLACSMVEGLKKIMDDYFYHDKWSTYNDRQKYDSIELLKTNIRDTNPWYIDESYTWEGQPIYILFTNLILMCIDYRPENRPDLQYIYQMLINYKLKLDVKEEREPSIWPVYP